MQKSTLTVLLLVTTLTALAAAWFWALAPMTTALLYIHSTGWTDADLIRQIWHFRLVQPEWVSTPTDYLRWTQAETLARLAVVFSIWLTSTALLVWRYLRSRTHTPPNHALQRTAAGRRGCIRRGSWPPSLSLGR